jgi:SagB-type dehydrogenase family enzyme
MNTIPMIEAGDLALLYHLNSEPWMNQQAYDEPSVMHAFRTIDDCETKIALPECPGSPVTDLIAARASCRRFADQPMRLEDLSFLLHHGYGVLGIRGSDAFTMHHRPTPSAGALFPLELYAVTRSVDGLENGVYHYAAWHHRLERIRSGTDIRELLPNLQEQFYITEANVLLFLTAVFPRTMTKYGPRGYRYVLLEAGHVAQNVCLLAAERKLATLCMGGFRDSYINDLLALDARTEGTVYAMAIGHAA